jgi:hypothetical protein
MSALSGISHRRSHEPDRKWDESMDLRSPY